MPEDKTTQDGNFVNDDTGDLAAAFEQAAAGQSHVKYVLTLYVTGLRPGSQRAIENIRRLCEEHLAGRYELRLSTSTSSPRSHKTRRSSPPRRS